MSSARSASPATLRTATRPARSPASKPRGSRPIPVRMRPEHRPTQSGTRAARLTSGEIMGTANFGTVGLDWQQRVNWDRLKSYRTERAREHMKKHGLGAMLCMYDENVRYLTGTLTPGWNRLKPGLRYALLCGDGAPVLFEQGDLGFQIERHAPWIPKENIA